MKTGKSAYFYLLVAISAVVLLLDASIGFTKDFKGVDFPNEVKVGQESCKLTGIGVRTKFFVKVYYGALYLHNPTKDRKQIINADEPKEVLLHVVYKEVTADKWIDGWKEGFANNVVSPSSELQDKINQFLKCFDGPVKSGETVRLSYIPGKGTQIYVKDKQKALIPGHDFMVALWSIWFGEHPASESLMKGMLGEE